jgi:hyperpolarization activated cyclic nucleotide-gated potassium channel 2
MATQVVPVDDTRGELTQVDMSTGAAVAATAKGIAMAAGTKKRVDDLVERAAHKMHKGKRVLASHFRMGWDGRPCPVIAYAEADFFTRWFNYAEPPNTDFTHLPFAIIHPKSWFMTFWEFCNIIMIMGCTVLVPMELGFDLETNIWVTVVSAIIDIFFLIDIFITFRCAYYLDHVLVIDQGKITCKYLRFWFWIDFVSASAGTFSYFLGQRDFNSLTTMKLLRIARCFKIIRLAHVQDLLDHLDKLGPEMFFLIRFLKIFTLAILCVHFIACGWWGVAQYTTLGKMAWPDIDGVLQSHVDEDPSYVLYDASGGVRGDFRTAPIFIQYMCSVYWAFVTVSTVGYGDINPTNIEERMFAVLCCFLGTTIFAYVISEISKVTSGKSYMDQMIKQRRDELEFFIQHFHLPPALKREVREYYNSQGAVICVDQRAILDDLNKELKDKLSQFLMRDVLLAVPLFGPMPEAVLVATIEKLRLHIYLANDYVTKKGERMKGLYLMSSGTAYEAGSHEHSRHRRLSLKEEAAYERTEAQLDSHANGPTFHARGSTFGIRSLVTRAIAENDVVATTLSEIFTLSLLSLRLVMKKFPDFRAEYDRWVFKEYPETRAATQAATRLEEMLNSVKQDHSQRQIALETEMLLEEEEEEEEEVHQQMQMETQMEEMQGRMEAMESNISLLVKKQQAASEEMQQTHQAVNMVLSKVERIFEAMAKQHLAPVATATAAEAPVAEAAAAAVPSTSSSAVLEPDRSDARFSASDALAAAPTPDEASTAEFAETAAASVPAAASASAATAAQATPAKEMSKEAQRRERVKRRKERKRLESMKSGQ